MKKVYGLIVTTLFLLVGNFAFYQERDVSSELQSISPQLNVHSTRKRNIDRVATETNMPSLSKHVVSRKTSALRSLMNSMHGLHEMNKLIPVKMEVEKSLLDHPEYIAQYPEVLLEHTKEHSRAAIALIHCLEAHPDPKAEEMLIQIAASDTFPAYQRMQSIVSLGARENLSSGGVDTLWSIYEKDITIEPQLAQSALLNVAVAASNYTGAASELSKDILQRLKNELQSEESAVSPGFVLDALGNTEQREVLDIASPLLDDIDPSIRQDAAYALRQVPGEDVDQILLQTAHEELHRDARGGAIEALSARPPTDELIDGVGELVLEEPDPGLRKSLIRYLTTHQEHFPQAKQVIEKLSRLESDEDNYELLVLSLHSRK